eukprot:6207205-Pleurochrysis_carterae.AAC.7
MMRDTVRARGHATAEGAEREDAGLGWSALCGSRTTNVSLPVRVHSRRGEVGGIGEGANSSKLNFWHTDN